MKVCGLTGGVGMGKSAAAKFFYELGARIIDTDELARELVQPGQPALAEIQKVFGGGIVSADGRLRRDELARIVFGDDALRRRLEEILHPRIRAGWLARVETWRQKNHPLAIVVIPLLFETRAENHFDKIICVACSPAEQHRRLLARGWTPEQARQRIAAQLPATEKIARSQFVVWTDGALEIHRRQVEQISAKLSCQSNALNESEKN